MAKRERTELDKEAKDLFGLVNIAWAEGDPPLPQNSLEVPETLKQLGYENTSRAVRVWGHMEDIYYPQLRERGITICFRNRISDVPEYRKIY